MRSQRDKAHFIQEIIISRQKVKSNEQLNINSFFEQIVQSSHQTHPKSSWNVEIIERVKRTLPQYGVPFRPTINFETFDDLNNIMTKCWKEDPNERPDFSILKTTIRKVNK